MKSQLQTLAVTVLLLGVAIGVGAQTNGNVPAKKVINNALSSVADSSSKSCDGVDCVISAVQDAKKSNDIKKMRAALDMAQQQLTDVKSKSHRASKIAALVKDHMDKIDEQRNKVKDEQRKLDALEYPTDEFIIAD